MQGHIFPNRSSDSGQSATPDSLPLSLKSWQDSQNQCFLKSASTSSSLNGPAFRQTTQAEANSLTGRYDSRLDILKP